MDMVNALLIDHLTEVASFVTMNNERERIEVSEQKLLENLIENKKK